MSPPWTVLILTTSAIAVRVAFVLWTAATPGFVWIDPDGYLEQASRLGTPAVREEARQWLERARDYTAGPVLRSQTDRIELLLREYDRPVAVAVVSDGATTVTILRVGELGSFDERSVPLTPGEYTFVGTRAGFRDVRREVRILPGGPPPTVRIACTEPIG